MDKIWLKLQTARCAANTLEIVSVKASNAVGSYNCKKQKKTID